MISKARSKFIKSLQIKKYRKQEQCFVVEGRKTVEQLLDSDFTITTIVATAAFLAHVQERLSPETEVIEATPAELSGLGEFKTNDAVLAVARMKPEREPEIQPGEYFLVLDDIRDPGNLGTIIRTADWYGIANIIASPQTADVYNPKVLHASMGSFLRVGFFYADLATYLERVRLPVWGTFLDGTSVHNADFLSGGLILIGNESNGISPSIERFVTHKITIPGYGQAESLNAALATGIVLDNLRRLQSSV